MSATISQGLYLLWLFLMGFAFLGLFRNSLDTVTIGLLSFPLGAALWVIFSVIIIVSGIPYNLTAMSILSFLYFAATATAIYLKNGFTKSDIWLLTMITVVFVAVSASVLVYKCVYVTEDSWDFISMSMNLTRYAGFRNPPINHWSRSFGVFVGLVYAGAAFLGFGYVYSYVPVLSFMFILSFSWFLYRALMYYSLPKLWSGLLAVLALFVFASTYFIIFQAFFIHTNMTAAVYLTLAIIGLWNHITDKKAVWLVLATIFLTGFALCRAEGSIIAMLVLVSFISLEGTSYKHAVGCVSAFTLIIFSWYLKLLLVFGFHVRGYILTSRNLLLILIALTVFFALVICSKAPVAAKIKTYSPRILLGILALTALSLTLFYRPSHALISFYALTGNLFRTYWDASWLLIFLLTGISFALKSIKNESFFINVVVSYLLFLYTMVFFRINPYRSGWWGDSGNRMLIHIFPTIIFYLFLKYGYNFPWRTESGNE